MSAHEERKAISAEINAANARSYVHASRMVVSIDKDISKLRDRVNVMERTLIECGVLDRSLATFVGDYDRYRTALQWIADSNPAATESQIICARRALGLDIGAT